MSDGTRAAKLVEGAADAGENVNEKSNRNRPW